MQNSSRLIVDLTAIRTNYHLLNEMLPKGSRLMPMIKASAYGTNSTVIAQCLQEQGASIFGVSYVSEGIALRESGINSSIFVLSAPFYELEDVVHYDLEPAINNLEEAKELNRLAQAHGKTIGVHVHVNTGMQRLGMLPQEAIQLSNHIIQFEHIHFEGIFSHFVAAESKQDDSFSLSQIELFRNTVSQLAMPPPWIHMANSSAFLRFSIPFGNMARVGLLLYGIFPFETTTNPLMPALSLHSRICGINLCNKGDTVGYRRTFMIEKPKAKIGIIPLGYHDGIRQFFSRGGYVIIHKKRAPIVGRICMDFFMVDLTEIPEAEIGDQVMIFGDALPVTKVASWGDMNVRELLTGLGTRIARKFITTSNTIGNESEPSINKAVFAL